MNIPMPHYLMFSEANRKNEANCRSGRWRFVLEAVDGETLLDVEDKDDDVDDPDRLELLAVVRGLESLDHPARVTLISAGQYVTHGFRRGLPEWRESDWKWERFGELVPIKNRDLWRRVDRALRFHSVHCRSWRFDRAHAPTNPPPSRTARHGSPAAAVARNLGSWLSMTVRRVRAYFISGWTTRYSGKRGRLVQPSVCG